MDVDPDFYDAELRLHNEHLRAAANVQPHDRVLDVGCGTGQTTREAAGAAVEGSALGVDLSAPMLEQARRLSDDAGLHNVTYVQADAQTHPFPSTHFDLCVSRFGTMFFADPVAAFTNIGRALRPGARLVLLVWQDHDRNEWATAIREALTVGTAAPAPTTNHPGPFSLADPAITTGSWPSPASPRSASRTSTSRSSTARTPPPPTTRCSASSTLRTCWPTWTPPRPGTHSNGSAPPSPRMTRAVASSSVRGPGSSPPSGDQTVRHVFDATERLRAQAVGLTEGLDPADQGHSSSRSDRRPGRRRLAGQRGERGVLVGSLAYLRP